MYGWSNDLSTGRTKFKSSISLLRDSFKAFTSESFSLYTGYMVTTVIFFLLSFILGATIGSFLNVIIDRVPRRETVIGGRSHCEHCRHKLAWYDLIPLLSYALLQGKCRYCHKPLSFYYPVIETVTGILFVLVAFSLFSPFSFFAALYYFYLVSTLIVIFFIDLRYGIIPFKIVFFMLLLTAVWYVILPQSISIFNFIVSALGVFAFFLLLFIVTKRRGLGFGDVVFVLLMGFILGFPKIILGLYIAFLSGALISLLLVFLGKKRMKGGTIPFGPFLVFGTFVSLFWGQMLIEKIMMYLLH